MSTRGFIAIDRGVFDHPSFAAEPFTEREAWIWMISEAAWKDATVRVGRAQIAIQRGSFAHSLRFLAARWRWTESRVRRFLQRLTGDALVVVQTTREATHVTICNYETYQSARNSDDAQIDAPIESKSTQSKQITNTSSLRSEVKNRGTRLPSDWQPSEADWLAAREAGLTHQQAEREAESFRDYWHSKPGKDAIKLDWSATWRNWCRRAFDRLPSKSRDSNHDRNRTPQRRTTGHDALAAALFGSGPQELPADASWGDVPGRDEPRGQILDLTAHLPSRSASGF